MEYNNNNESQLPKEAEDLKKINDSIRYFDNRARFYEKQEASFKEYNMNILVEKAGHEVDICRASSKRLQERKTKLLMLLN